MEWKGKQVQCIDGDYYVRLQDCENVEMNFKKGEDELIHLYELLEELNICAHDGLEDGSALALENIRNMTEKYRIRQ